MQEHDPNPEPSVPAQRETTAPVRKSMPVVIALVVIVALIGMANISSLMSGKKRTAPPSSLPMRPAAPNAQQISSFETQQKMQAQRDADERKRQQEITAAMQQLQAAQDVPGPEATSAPPMTAAQSAAIYGESPDAPQHTSNVSQAQAEAKQRQLEREKQRRDALNSDTVAIDFAHPTATNPSTAVLAARAEEGQTSSTETASQVPPDFGGQQAAVQPTAAHQEGQATRDPMAPSISTFMTDACIESLKARSWKVWSRTTSTAASAVP